MLNGNAFHMIALALRVIDRLALNARAARMLSAVLVLTAYSASSARAGAQTRAPRLYLSCPTDCYDKYLKQELSYFDFVRDPRQADYTLVVTRQRAANGGERLSVTCTPTAANAGIALATSGDVSWAPGTTDHTLRPKLAQLMLRLLYERLSGDQKVEVFELRVPRRDGAQLSELADPWKYWVLTPQLTGAGEAGSGYYFAELIGSLTVRRVTEQSKVRVRGGYQRNLSGYRLEDGNRIRGDVYGWNARALYAHSVRQRSALGTLATARASEFENLRLQLYGGPVVEFNVFPYRENTTRQLRFAYQLGPWANWYFERNEADLRREVRPYHALSLVVDVNQPWGSVQCVAQVNSFLNEPKLFRASLGPLLSLRLFEGFALTLKGEGAYVRDLINLRGRPVTDNELLLWTAQQRTKFTLEFAISFSYTFGSVHNTIVNPRFGLVDLQDD